MGSAVPYFIYPGFAFVAYPNRDSTPYKERYNIPEDRLSFVVRSDIQVSQSSCMCLSTLAFLSEGRHNFLQPSDKPLPWTEAARQILKAWSGKEPDLIWAISSKTKFMNSTEKDRILADLRWIGLFSKEPITPRGTLLDTLCASLEQKVQYEEVKGIW